MLFFLLCGNCAWCEFVVNESLSLSGIWLLFWFFICFGFFWALFGLCFAVGFLLLLSPTQKNVFGIESKPERRYNEDEPRKKSNKTKGVFFKISLSPF